MNVNEDELIAMMPAAGSGRVSRYIDAINTVLEQYEINTLMRRAAFLATVAHETAQLHYMAEVWGPTRGQLRYDPPGSLATRLGNTKIGDGRRYRGRGLLMLTGRDNYARASEALGYDLVADPDIVETSPDWAAATAGWFWAANDLNTIADSEDFEAVTVAINGGTNGMQQRDWFYQRAIEVLPA